MKTNNISLLAAGLACAMAMAVSTQAKAADAELDCKLDYSITGWSAIYKHSSGTGTVHCANGDTMRVTIEAKGGGLTFGKSEIHDGLGKFTEVYDIEDVLGAYASAGAHAGAAKSAEAQALTKGPVSLALSGKGTGWDLGVAFGKFTIRRR